MNEAPWSGSQAHGPCRDFFSWLREPQTQLIASFHGEPAAGWQPKSSKPSPRPGTSSYLKMESSSPLHAELQAKALSYFGDITQKDSVKHF